MKKLSLLFLFGLFISILLCSCKHTYYMPNTHNVPLFREKGEFRASILSGSAEHISSTEGQIAYSLTDQFAVMGNFFYGIGGNSGSNSEGFYTDAALGYYKPISAKGVFEIYAGAGISNQHHNYSGTYFTFNDGYSNLAFQKFFIQPSIGRGNHNFEVAFSSRFALLSFYSIENKISTKSEEYKDLDRLSKHRTSVLFEPALTLRGGWKYVKVQVQYSTSENFSHLYLPFEKVNINIGLMLMINKNYRNTPAKQLEVYPMD